MKYSSPAQGFRLAYDRHGSGKPVVLLHGWPGDRSDYDAIVRLLVNGADVIVPDLRGFGESDKHQAMPKRSTLAWARRMGSSPFWKSLLSRARLSGAMMSV